MYRQWNRHVLVWLFQKLQEKVLEFLLGNNKRFRAACNSSSARACSCVWMYWTDIVKNWFVNGMSQRYLIVCKRINQMKEMLYWSQVRCLVEKQNPYLCSNEICICAAMKSVSVQQWNPYLYSNDNNEIWNFKQSKAFLGTWNGISKTMNSSKLKYKVLNLRKVNSKTQCKDN